MQSDPSTHTPGPQSPTPSIGEIEVPPPPPSDVEEMLPVGFSELNAIAASPVLGVELLPPPSTDSNSADSSYLLPLDGHASTGTTDSSALLETTATNQRQHDLTNFDVERGFWRVYHGARELLRYATIYQEHRDSMMRSYREGHRPTAVNKPLFTIPREIDLESMTQLSWGVARAVADINAYDRRMNMSLSGRNSGLASPRPEGHHNESSNRISKRKKKQRRAPSRVSGKQQQQKQQTAVAYKDTEGDTAMQYNVCKVCGTLHSPQWRYGPEGLRNLCNVCGLLHAKKTQRKMMRLEEEEERRSNVV